MATAAQFLTPNQAGQQLGLTVGALAQMRYLGRGPVFIKLGGRSVRYRQSDIDAWVEQCVRTRSDERTAPKAG